MGCNVSHQLARDIFLVIQPQARRSCKVLLNSMECYHLSPVEQRALSERYPNLQDSPCLLHDFREPGSLDFCTTSNHNNPANLLLVLL